MTSQPLGPNTYCVNVTSFIRGYHAYQENWLLHVGEILVLETEPLNPVDGYAVTIVRSGTVVGHVPRNLSALYFHFLTRNGNKGVTEVTGMKINRGVGYGLEILCHVCIACTDQTPTFNALRQLSKIYRPKN